MLDQEEGPRDTINARHVPRRKDYAFEYLLDPSQAFSIGGSDLLLEQLDLC